MPYESHTDAVLGQMRAAARAGTIAAAQVYINGVKRELRGGYTTGEYVTGNVINSVTRTELDAADVGTYEDNDGIERATPEAEPSPHQDGVEIVVGTNLLYALYWELGWSPRMDKDIAGLAGGSLAAPSFRVPIWMPQLGAQRPAMQAAFERTYNRFMK